ncbi:MAG: HIT family protein [Pseudonocardiaceae bacterium]
MTTTLASGCAFCRIADGSGPARVVAEYPSAIAFFPTNPAVLGHTLVVPRQHVVTIWDLDLDHDTAHALCDATLDVSARISGTCLSTG